MAANNNLLNVDADSSLCLAQERRRPLLQLHSSSHPLLREAGSAHPSWIQYPSLSKQASLCHFCQHNNESHFFVLISLTTSPSEIFNAEVLFREDSTPDEFIDVIVGNRVYMPCLYVRRSSRDRSVNLSALCSGVGFIAGAVCRCTTRWIRSPSRKWTVWLVGPTVSSSGPTSVTSGRKISAHILHSCMWEIKVFLTLFFSKYIFQLWHEVKPGLPSGDVVGVPGSNLHLH